MTRLRLLALTLTGLALGAAGLHCSNPFTPTGQLGNGQFFYSCAPGTFDVACAGVVTPEAAVAFEDPSARDEGTTSIPRVLAVGASFGVTYTQIDDPLEVQGVSGYTVTSASIEVAAPSGDLLTAKKSGFLGLLAYSAVSQTVDDFIVVDLEPIATLTPSLAELTVGVGEQGDVHVSAADAAGEGLAGRLACGWSVATGAGAAAIVGPAGGAGVTLQGLAPGAASVHVTCGAASAEIAVQVHAAPRDGGAPGEGGDHG